MAENQWRWVGPDGFEYTGDLATLKAGLTEGRLPPTTMVSGAELDGWLPAAEVPELAPPAFAPAPAEPKPLPTFQVEDEAPTTRDNPIPEPAPVVEPPTERRQAVAAPPTVVIAERPPAPMPAPPPKQPPLLLIVALVALGAFVLGGISVLFVVARSDKAPDPAARPAASASSTPPPPDAAARACVASPAALVARPVFGKIPLEVAAAGPGRIAVAFARTKSEAQLVVLAADTLEKRHEKRHPSRAAVSVARPLVRGDAVELVLDAEEPKLRGQRSISGEKPLRIGIAPTGIAKSAGDGEPEVVWPLAEKDLTPVRLESSETIGHYVALRSGGQGGKVLSGWLAPDGSKKTDFVAPELAARAVGTPAPALGAKATLLLVAAKPGEASEWQLYAGKAALGQAPTKLSPLGLGEGGPRISPAAAGLPSGGWLVQWTEGPEGAHVVKLQELDAELAPLGKPVRVSPQGSDAGQGRVWSDGERAVSFFLVSTGEAHELWAAALACK